LTKRAKFPEKSNREFGDAELRQFRTERKDHKEKCLRVAGKRLMPLIGGRFGKSPPLRRWQMKAILG
jgi:hypothetical protein